MFSNRFLRLTAAALLMLAVCWTLFPHATNYISTSAVVNAPLLSIKSPIDGRIEAASSGLAEAVATGQRMVLVQSGRKDRELLQELLARDHLLAAETEAKARQARELSALRAEMARREELYRSELAGWLRVHSAELRAELEAATATRQETEDRIARSRALAGEGTLALANLKQDEAELARATAAVGAAQARLEATGRELEALGQGILVQHGTSDVSYSQQRIDDIDLRLNELSAEREGLAADRAALAARIKDAERENAARESFEPIASARGVIWRASGAPGSAILTGDEIMQVVDCERRFVEVAVSERLFDAIRPGSTAWVQFRGSSEHFAAKVAAVRGSGAKFSNPQLAAETPVVAEGQLRVLVPLQPAQAGVTSASGGDAAFCDVGRTAEVRFERDYARRLFGMTGAFAGLGESLRGWFGRDPWQTANADQAAR